jgi:hypothetical protein
VIDALAVAAVAYASGGYFVVLDAIVGPWLLHRLMARADADRIEVDYVVLRPALSVAMQRACSRSGQALTDPGPVARMHSDFSALGPYERHVIDSASMSPQDMAEAVRSSVATGTMRLRHG